MSNLEFFLESGHSSHAALLKKAVCLLGGEEAWENIFEDVAELMGVDSSVNSKWSKKAKVDFFESGGIGLINTISRPTKDSDTPLYTFKRIALNTNGMSMQRVINLSRYGLQPSNIERQILAEFGLFCLAAEYKEWCNAECHA